MNRRLRHSRITRLGAALLAVLLLNATVARSPMAQDAEAEPAAVETTFEEVPEYLKTGQYEKAELALRAAIEEAQRVDDFDRLRVAYLLLVKTYTIRSNFFRQIDEQTAELYLEKAATVTRECLQIPQLRRTRPDSPLEYPPEMFDIFDDVRQEIFGSFRVVGLQPADAVVILDGDTLQVRPGETFVGETDIPIGPHEVVVAHVNYRTVNDAINISPGATLERPYVLERKRGGWWYVGVSSAGAAGAAGLTWLILAIIDKPPEPPPTVDPLPGPPAPPSQ